MVNFMHNWAQKWADRSPRSYVMWWVSFWNFCSLSSSKIDFNYFMLCNRIKVT